MVDCTTVLAALGVGSFAGVVVVAHMVALGLHKRLVGDIALVVAYSLLGCWVEVVFEQS
jgi:hypothetical protein